MRRALRKIAALQTLQNPREGRRSAEGASAGTGGRGARRMRSGSQDDVRAPDGGRGDCGGNAADDGGGGGGSFRPPALRNGAYRPTMTAEHHLAWVAATGWAAQPAAPQARALGPDCTHDVVLCGP